MKTIVREAFDPPDREHCYAIRIEVFCGEQKVSREIEFDGLDDECRHYLALQDDAPVGTARTRPIGDGKIKFERIAVRAEHRRRNVGQVLMLQAMRDAVEDGAVTAVLNAQTSAGDFYEKLGFVRKGDIFMEAGIEHIHMVRDLSSF